MKWLQRFGNHSGTAPKTVRSYEHNPGWLDTSFRYVVSRDRHELNSQQFSLKINISPSVGCEVSKYYILFQNHSNWRFSPRYWPETLSCNLFLFFIVWRTKTVHSLLKFLSSWIVRTVVGPALIGKNSWPPTMMIFLRDAEKGRWSKKEETEGGGEDEHSQRRS